MLKFISSNTIIMINSKGGKTRNEEVYNSVLVVLAIIGVAAIGIAASKKGQGGNGQGQNNNDQGCKPGSTQSCTAGLGICADGKQTCNKDGEWGRCVSQVTPTGESCGNGLDDDCDGQVDEDCCTQNGYSCSSNSDCCSGLCSCGSCCEGPNPCPC
jgi:hypothetical protein